MCVNQHIESFYYCAHLTISIVQQVIICKLISYGMI